MGRTQQVGGSIGVSLTILEPVAETQPRVIAFDVDRAGIVHIESTLPTSARTSRLVMARVSSSTNGIAAEPQLPMLVPHSRTDSECVSWGWMPKGSGLLPRCEMRLEREAHVIPSERSRSVVIPSERSVSTDPHLDRPIELRVEYLIVEGT